jgi:ABC-2 type transport system permease protein
VFVSFFIYTGFDFIAELPGLSAWNDILIQFGMIEHFRSISRGVLDSRDFLYFISLSLIFLLLSDLNLFLNKK